MATYCDYLISTGLISFISYIGGAYVSFDKNLMEIQYIYGEFHGLRTPNEGINQRYLKFWADVADEICFGRT